MSVKLHKKGESILASKKSIIVKKTSGNKNS